LDNKVKLAVLFIVNFYLLGIAVAKMETRENCLVTVLTRIDKVTLQKVEKFLRENPEIGFLSAERFICAACFLRVAEYHMQREVAEPRL